MNKHVQTRTSDAPAREDGKDWHSRHHLAAQLRAKGKTWQQVADEIGVHKNTAAGYSGIAGFAELESFYRDAFFDAEVEAHFREGSLAALQALRDQYTAGAHEVAAIERRIAAIDEAIIEAQEVGDVEGALALIADRNDLAKQIYSKSKVTTLAAGKYLDAIGFSTHRKRKAELETEKGITDHYGQTVRHEGGERPIEISNLTQEQLGDRYRDILAKSKK
jgi:hypothetical protein